MCIECWQQSFDNTDHIHVETLERFLKIKMRFQRLLKFCQRCFSLGQRQRKYMLFEDYFLGNRIERKIR